MDRGLRRALQAALALTALSMAVVAATGIWLARNYRPPAVKRVTPFRDEVVSKDRWIHEMHVWSATTLQAAAAIVLLLLIVGLVRRRDAAVDRLAVLASAIVVGAVALGLRTSKGLRWNQLALWAVTVGSDFKGVWRAGDSKAIRFVLMDGHKVSTSDYRHRVVAHLIAAPALLLAATLLLAVVLWRGSPKTTRRQPVPRP